MTTVENNGQSAVELCKVQTFDAILMDLSLPIMNGFDAAAAIREMETSNGSTPIIALSAHADSESKERSLEIGMNEYLTKPIHLGTLQKVLQQYI
jgi:CheY-like chemotaxis protein